MSVPARRRRRPLVAPLASLASVLHVALAALAVGAAPGAARAAAAQQGGWHVGDQVEAYNVSWYDATITEVGAGRWAGYYKVHYDKFSAASDQYIRATNVRARPDAAAAAGAAQGARAAGPRLGRYRILSFGAGGAPLVLGELTLLPAGRYRTTLPGGRAAGEGAYAYDPAAGAVRWLSGPMRDDGWGGAFTVEREGKTHQLRLRGGTVAVNSVGG